MTFVPEKAYRTPVYDNARWAEFVHRPGDIFICTPPKCGTTWMQTIVTSLMWPAGDPPGSVWELSPWLDAEFEPIEEVLARLEAQPHRRFIKTHTPRDGIPRFDTASYIVVLRDGRDMLMSFSNHLEHMRSDVVAELNARAAADGVTVLPEYDGDVHQLFEFFLIEPMPVAYLAHWWPHRLEPNVLLVHYNDLKADLEGEMRRVARFLELEVPEDAWPAVVERCTFESMKARADEIAPFERIFEGGAQTFLYKATNGRWRDVLTADELDRYAARVAELLPPDAAGWLADGSLGTGRRPEHP
jgi:aryl sulfotransferase